VAIALHSALPVIAATTAMPATTTTSPGDFGHPKSVWSRKLGMMDQVSALNTYLSESTPLTAVQRETFWQLAREAWVLFQGEANSPDLMAARLTKAWNSRHIWLLQGQNSLGLGGLMRVGHVKAILKVQGYRLKEVDMGLRLSIFVQARDKGTVTQPTKAVLCQQDVHKLTHRDTEPWLRKLGKNLSKQKGDRLQTLHNYFDDKPDDHELTL
jgi:hypothetical protein